MNAAQAQAILAAFETWLSAGPGRRRIVLEGTHGAGFIVSLDEERPAVAPTLQDAAAQAATVASLEVTS